MAALAYKVSIVFIYRFLYSLALPFILLDFGIRLIRRSVRIPDVKQRLGLCAPSDDRTIWIHGASTGELAAGKLVLTSLRNLRPNDRLLVTSNSEEGRALVASWQIENCDTSLAPIDHRILTRRFLQNQNIRAAITLENEFWPNRMIALAELNRPHAILGARISARAAEKWARLPMFTNRVLQTIRLMAAVDPDSQDRFVSLGLPNPRVAPRINLRSLYAPENLPADPDLAAVFPHELTWLAASTHNGEETIILEAFGLVRRRYPGIKLIIAPRNPKRAPEVAGLVSLAGFHHARRSSGAVPSPDTDVYIADTFGELPRWYEMAPITFVGGSLADVGGHSPFKPMMHGTALIHGPHVGNHRSIYALLDQAKAAVRVSDASSLAQAVRDLLDPAKRADQLQKTRAIPSEEHALEKILARFVDLL